MTTSMTRRYPYNHKENKVDRKFVYSLMEYRRTLYQYFCITYMH